MGQDLCGNRRISKSLDSIKEVLPNERNYPRNLQFTGPGSELEKRWVTEGKTFLKFKDSRQVSCPRYGVLTDKYQASVVVDHIHSIQDANIRVHEARRIERDTVKHKILGKIFLVGKEKFNARQKKQVEMHCKKYPSLKEF